jgi:hypothetical protein
MKKYFVILLLLLLVGCEEPSSEVKNTTSNIDGARLVKIKQDISMMITRAETDYMIDSSSFVNNCIDVKKYDNNYTGRICYENNDFKAFNVENEYYNCNGGKSELECIKLDQ